MDIIVFDSTDECLYCNNVKNRANIMIIIIIDGWLAGCSVLRRINPF